MQLLLLITQAEDFARVQLVFGLIHGQLVFLLGVAENFAVRQNVGRTLMHVFLDGRFDQGVPLAEFFCFATAGSILSTIACRFDVGIFSPEQAAVTAPHFVCPSTTSTVLPRCS